MNLLIICDKCNQEVERVVAYQDYQHRTTTIQAHCHGEIDEMTIPDSELSKMGQSQINEMLRQPGHAFQMHAVETGGAVQHASLREGEVPAMLLPPVIDNSQKW